MMVGDAPGEDEDLKARPFVGRAGQLLDELMAQAGIDRSRTWMTNTIKHFKWELRGGTRKQLAPGQRDVAACRVWLDEELRRVQPQVVVALGAIATKALLGASATIEMARRAGPVQRAGVTVVATYHPLALLRLPEGGRGVLRAAVEEDLARVAALLAAGNDRNELAVSDDGPQAGS
jgi:uracil-DNA glycosylase